MYRPVLLCVPGLLLHGNHPSHGASAVLYWPARRRVHACLLVEPISDATPAPVCATRLSNATPATVCATRLLYAATAAVCATRFRTLPDDAAAGAPVRGKQHLRSNAAIPNDGLNSVVLHASRVLLDTAIRCLGALSANLRSHRWPLNCLANYTPFPPLISSHNY